MSPTDRDASTQPAARRGAAVREAAGGSTAGLRRANQHRVISAVRAATPASTVTQAQLARSTGLAPATVSNIVRELADAGVLETTSGAGRRGTEVRIARDAGLLAGIDFGHRHVRIAVGDLSGRVLAETRAPLQHDHSIDEGLGLAESLLDSALDEVGADRSTIRGAGLGLPAPVDAEGLVVSASILPGWVGADATALMTERLGVPVYLDNDANLGALAEHRFGAGVGHDCMVFLKVSSGVGAGLIINGQLFHGGAGTAGEIGHLTVDESGPLCRCGSRGCLEAYTSAVAITDMLASQQPGAAIRELVDAARAGSVAVRRVFEDVGSHLGWAVAIMVNLLNPTALILGGDLALAGEFVVPTIESGVRRHVLGMLAASLTVSTSALGDRSGMLGALQLAVDLTPMDEVVAQRSS